jgi:hypothetical protein
MGDRKDRYKPFNELNKPITSTLLPHFRSASDHATESEKVRHIHLIKIFFIKPSRAVGGYPPEGAALQPRCGAESGQSGVVSSLATAVGR